MMLRDWTPASRLACGLIPTDSMSMPSAVRRVTVATTATTAPAMRTAAGSPKQDPEDQRECECDAARDKHRADAVGVRRRGKEAARESSGDRHHGTHRQIDPARGDHQGHPQLHQDQWRAVAQDVDQRSVEVTVLHPDVEERRRADRVGDEQRDERCQRPEESVAHEAHDVEVAHQACPPLAISSTTSSRSTVSSLRISATLRRSRMMTIRWLRRNTSSSSAEMKTTDMPSVVFI